MPPGGGIGLSSPDGVPFGGVAGEHIGVSGWVPGVVDDASRINDDARKHYGPLGSYGAGAGEKL